MLRSCQSEFKLNMICFVCVFFFASVILKYWSNQGSATTLPDSDKLEIHIEVMFLTVTDWKYI